LRDGANAEEDEVKYGSTYSRLLRSGRSKMESMERKIDKETNNRSFEESKALQKPEAKEVKRALCGDGLFVCCFCNFNTSTFFDFFFSAILQLFFLICFIKPTTLPITTPTTTTSQI
jgi:hypothetical protein